MERKWRGDEENTYATVTLKEDLQQFDEMTVRGADDHQKLVIPLKKLHSEGLEKLKECLEDIQFTSQKLVGLIDSLDEMSLPFSIYNSFKKLSEIDLNSKDLVINIICSKILH